MVSLCIYLEGVGEQLSIHVCRAFLNQAFDLVLNFFSFTIYTKLGIEQVESAVETKLTC